MKLIIKIGLCLAIISASLSNAAGIASALASENSTSTGQASTVAPLTPGTQGSDNIDLAQITLSFNNQNQLQIVPLASTNNLSINLAAQTIASETAKQGSNVVGTSASASALSGAIQGLSADLLTKIKGGATILFVLNSDKPASLPSSGVLYSSNYWASATDYVRGPLNLDADTLANNQNDINTQVFGWLSAIVQQGKNWAAPSKASSIVSILTSDTATCPAGKLCFYASELTSIQQQLQGLTASTIQARLYSLIQPQSSNAASSTASANQSPAIVYAALLKLIAVYLYTQIPTAQQANFSLPTCAAYSPYTDISNQILGYNSGSTNSVASAQQTIQAAATALQTCIQNKDGITPASYCADNGSSDPLCTACLASSNGCTNSSWSTGAYLSASVNQGTSSCSSQFAAYAQALSGITQPLLSLYNIIVGYPLSLKAAGALATNTNYLNGFTLGTNQLKPCNGTNSCTGSGTCPVVFGTQAAIVKGGSSLNYGANSANAGNPYNANYDMIALTDAKSNALQTIVEYDNNGNYLGKAIFFDGKNNPLVDSNNNYIQNFWLANDGIIYAACPKGKTCAAVVACPTNSTAAPCKMITAQNTACTSANTTTTGTTSCKPLSLNAGSLYNTICLVQQDIAQQIANQAATCTGVLTPSDLQNLDQAQIKAIDAQQKAQQTVNQGTWNTVNNMGLMPILFPLVGMAVEAIKHKILEVRAASAAAKKLGISKEQYTTLQEKGLVEDYTNIKEFNDKNNLGLSIDEMTDAASTAKLNDVDAVTAAKAKALKKLNSNLTDTEALKMAAEVDATDFANEKFTEKIKSLTGAQTEKIAELAPAQEAKVVEVLAEGKPTGLAIAQAESAGAQTSYEASAASTEELSVEKIAGVDMSDLSNLSSGDKINLGGDNFTFNDKITVGDKTYFELTNEDGAKEWGSFADEEAGTGFDTTDEDPRGSPDEAPVAEGADVV